LVTKLQCINDNPGKMPINVFISTWVQEQPALTKDKSEQSTRIN
jgi:hypothetical protein